jgi:fatty acid desaturase
MLAPLPPLYRDLVVGIVLVIGIVAGTWITLVTSGSAVAGAGVLLGAAAGLLAAFVLVHDFSHRAQPARVTRRR